MMDVASLCSLLGMLLLMGYASVSAKECYVCSGAFPERECELWPSRVRHGPVKQECGNRFCTSYVRYRPMQHLLIPLGPNKPKATATPLRPEDFEVISITRDCVDRVDKERDNHCFPDTDGLGATCFTSCSTPLCNKGLRRPQHAELHPPGNVPTYQHPTGPNEFDRWTPPAQPTRAPVTYAPTAAPVITTTTVERVLETRSGMDGEKTKMGGEETGRGRNKNGGRRLGKGGKGRFGGLGGEAQLESGAGSAHACAALVTVCVATLQVLRM